MSQAPRYDLSALRSRWPAIRDEVWVTPVDRAVYAATELVGVEGPTLVIQMSYGHLRLFSAVKQQAAADRLVRLMGVGTRVRFIDDRVPYRAVP